MGVCIFRMDKELLKNGGGGEICMRNKLQQISLVPLMEVLYNFTTISCGEVVRPSREVAASRGAA